uniref:Uncharacterized protein n=1 Tax=Triticum urartu TaxID=4572 RepID=A0A8R7TNV6_TRIUA
MGTHAANHNEASTATDNTGPIWSIEPPHRLPPPPHIHPPQGRKPYRAGHLQLRDPRGGPHEAERTGP